MFELTMRLLGRNQSKQKTKIYFLMAVWTYPEIIESNQPKQKINIYFLIAVWTYHDRRCKKSSSWVSYRISETLYGQT